MAISASTVADDLARIRGLPLPAADAERARATSAVAWGAVAAGAAAAAALSLILLILGVGLGLSSVSPWARDGLSGARLGVSTILWLTLTQLLASAMGGYLAGRLRTRWTALHSDEVYFRDTAHGFLAWAVSSLATAALLTSVIGSILGSGLQAGATVAGGAAPAALGAAAARLAPDTGTGAGPLAYFTDLLFRPGTAAPATAPAEPTASAASQDAAEVGRIFLQAGAAGPLPPEDLLRIGQLVAQRTGLALPDAQQRAADVHARVQAMARDADLATRTAADQARKASAYGALWLFVSLLVGAFVASLAATFGGRRRDA